MEVVNHPDGTLTATRYYTHGGRQIAVRTDDESLYWLAADHQGTTTATVESLTHQTEVRYRDLYGSERGTPAASWVDDHGFLGGVEDPSGLTHLGAREYDPALGRFISADPVLDLTDSQQMGGYAYANHSPVTFSDPTGLFIFEDADGGGQQARTRIDSEGNRITEFSGDIDEARKEISDDLQKEADQARDILNTSIVDVVIDVGADILLDLIGVNDIKSCIGAGDMWACASLLMDLIP